MSRTHNIQPKFCDFLIVGGGIAGMKLALNLSKLGKVTILAKSELMESNTRYAQGGIAFSDPSEDAVNSHIEDTMQAGAGINNREIVELVARRSSASVQDLVDVGVNFSRDNENVLHRHREGGHSQRRILHAHDATGLEIVRALLAAVNSTPTIQVLSGYFATDLLIEDVNSEKLCFGLEALEVATATKHCWVAPYTFLCTGGHGRIYKYTSNPDSATGDGVAMAWRAGAVVSDLEFMQFHPTCLYEAQSKTYLLSEAMRGEGGVIRNRLGEDFIAKVDPRGSLAPRDIVARSIHQEMQKTGEKCVFLDMTALDPVKVLEQFPTIAKECSKHGIDISKDRIPIVPAAHYSCGGVKVDAHARTNVQNLYALGEVSCTGLHGANRLASNSLLEAAVFADIVSQDFADKLNAMDREKDKDLPLRLMEDHPATQDVKICGKLGCANSIPKFRKIWAQIRSLMWEDVGIVRKRNALLAAERLLSELKIEVDALYEEHGVCESSIELRNLATVAWLTAKAAYARKESVGTHYCIDR